MEGLVEIAEAAILWWIMCAANAAANSAAALLADLWWQALVLSRRLTLTALEWTRLLWWKCLRRLRLARLLLTIYLAKKPVAQAAPPTKDVRTLANDLVNGSRGSPALKT